MKFMTPQCFAPVPIAASRRFGHENGHKMAGGDFFVSEMAIEAATFRQVLGAYPTGVSVITAMGTDDNPLGMVVGTFTSVSLDPPLVGFLPDKGSSTWPLIETAGHFCVNVLGSDQTETCRKLASRGPEKFAGVEYAVSQHNLPVIAGSIVRIECRLHSVTDAGDHWFVLGQVLDLEVTRDGDPMLFHRGQYGGFARLD
jgi:flavin reductase (DIM6/NTAB) family NADH-FMN oxidoreductase RutF